MKIQEQTKESTGSSNELYQVPLSLKRKFFLRELFFFAYHCTRLALVLAIIILISQTTTQSMESSSGFRRMQEVIEIWGKDVIVDAITTSTYNCPAGYEPYSSAEWHGTKEGCLCTTTLLDYDYIHVLPGQCSFKLIDAGCTKVLPQQALPFAFWHPGNLICIKRIRELDFFSGSLTEIESETQICASGQPYEFTSLKDEECPITSISNISNQYTYPLGNIGFSFEREDDYPVADLRISEYSFCIRYGKDNISPNRFQNYDLVNVEIEHCSESDPRVTEIDQVTEKYLFEANERIYEIVSEELPIYPQPTEQFVYKLGMVRYPPWTYACRTSTDFSLAQAQQNYSLETAGRYSENCMYFSIVILLIWGVLYAVLCLAKHAVELRSRKRQHILYLPDAEVIRINPNLLSGTLKLSLGGEVILFLILLVLSLSLLINIGVQYGRTDHLEIWMRGSEKCMDGADYMFDWVAEGYASALQEILRNYLICILCGVVVTCLDIIYSVWRLEKGDLAQQKLSSIFETSTEPSGRDSDEDKLDKDLGKNIDFQKMQVEQKSEGMDDMRKTHNVMNVMNPTEESLAHMNDEEVLEDELFYERPVRSNKKKKKNPMLKKLQYFDIQ